MKSLDWAMMSTNTAVKVNQCELLIALLTRPHLLGGMLKARLYSPVSANHRRSNLIFEAQVSERGPQSKPCSVFKPIYPIQLEAYILILLPIPCSLKLVSISIAHENTGTAPYIGLLPSSAPVSVVYGAALLPAAHALFKLQSEDRLWSLRRGWVWHRHQLFDRGCRCYPLPCRRRVPPWLRHQFCCPWGMHTWDLPVPLPVSVRVFGLAYMDLVAWFSYARQVPWAPVLLENF